MKNWVELIDCVVLSSEEDPDLKEGLKYLDEKAQHRGISIYDMLIEVYQKKELEKRIQDWKAAKAL